MSLAPDDAVFASLRAVLFDLDGTLVETHIDFPKMIQAMRALALSADVPAAAIDGKDILGVIDAAASHVQHYGGDWEALRRSAFSQLEEMEVAGCAHPALLPGARELLSDLHRTNRRIGIVTRNCRRVSVGLLERYELPHDALLTRDDVRLAKPNPEHLWDTLRLLDSSPDDAAMVGDHWMDMQAGRAARCAATLGVLGGHADDWFAPCPPTRTVTDLRAALTLFRTGGA